MRVICVHAATQERASCIAMSSSWARVVNGTNTKRRFMIRLFDPVDNDPMEKAILAPQKGEEQRLGPYSASAAELHAFHQQWSPTPVGGASDRSPPSHLLSLCIAERLLAGAAWRDRLLEDHGFEQPHYHASVIPDLAMHLEIEFAEVATAGTRVDCTTLGRLVDDSNNWIVSFQRRLVLSADGDDAGSVAAVRRLNDAEAFAVGTALAGMKASNVNADARISYLMGHLDTEQTEAQAINQDFESGYARGVSQSLGMQSHSEYQPHDETFFAIAVQLGAQSMQEMMNADAEAKEKRQQTQKWITAAVCVVAIFSVLMLLGLL